MTQKPEPSNPAISKEQVPAEVQARAERLMRDLQQAPAIACPITFNWHGNQELADAASFRIRLYGQMMRDEWPSMSFDALTGIVFHHDYELALTEAARKDGAAPVPTKEAGGFSVGMMVRAEDGVQLVMHESVALALSGGDQEQSDWAQHIVRHELCHVDDFAFKKALIAKRPDRSSYSGFEVHLAPLAEALWDEFYANNYSTGPWSDRRMSLDLLRDATPAIHGEIVDSILDYRNSGDLEVLLALAAPKVKFIAQCFGYAAGTLAALGVTLEHEAPEEHATLQRLGLLEAWSQCSEVLLDLDRARPNWESVLDLSKLFPGCLALFAGFGLHYRPHGEGAYVDIPATPQTGYAKAMLRRLGKHRRSLPAD